MVLLIPSRCAFQKFAGCASEGAAEGARGGNFAAPERSAGAKRRRSVPFKKSSSEVYNYSTNIKLSDSRPTDSS